MPNIASVNQDRGISPSRAKGAAVHLVAMREAFVACGANVMAFDLPGHGEMIAALELGHAERPFDLIYERYALARRAASDFARDHDVPRVLEVNAPLAEEAARHRGVRESSTDRADDRVIFEQADLVVAVSGQVAEYAIARGARKSTVMVCPNGIDTKRFNANVAPFQLGELGVPQDRFVIGFHGRERPWHGFGQLVTVVGNLASAGLPVHLLVVGEGEFSGLDELPADRYTRIGWQPHEAVPQWVATFNALPLTYAADAPCYFSPLKLTEAMACGVVPIVPDMGDLPRHVVHDKTGLVYRAGDWQSLENAIGSLARDTDLHCSLGEQAAAFAATQGWDKIARTILNKTGLIPAEFLLSL